MTVGTPAAFASSTGRTSARRSSGASTMPCTPCVVNPSTTWIWSSRSSSRSGPFQMMFTESPATVSSCDAWIAPAWMLFQNSCDVPLGTTAMVIVLPEVAAPFAASFFPEQAAAAARRARAMAGHDFIDCSVRDGFQKEGGSRALPLLWSVEGRRGAAGSPCLTKYRNRMNHRGHRGHGGKRHGFEL